MATITQQSPDRTVKKKGVDHTLRWIAVIAAAVSVVAFFYFNAQGLTLSYKDAISHLDIARRVIDSPTRGLAQLGGVWLPLPHLLAIPFIWIDALYYSGFAGSILSMLAYVATSVLLYKITLSLTHHKIAAVISAVVFMANPNVLYMQSTPMTELLMFMCMAGMVYGVQKWIITDHYKYLIAGAAAGLFGTLTRYESWVLLGSMTLVVLYVAWKKRYPYVKLEGIILAFMSVGILGIMMWMLWNLLIFNNFLYFQIGDYAKPSLWVGEAEAAVGDWWISFLTYLYATLDNLWPPITLLMLVGLGMIVVREHFTLKTLPTFSLLTLFPFFVVALEQGQRPLHVAQITGDLYNVRFGLLMVLPAAITIGYIISALDKTSPMKNIITGAIVACVALFGIVSFLTPNGIAVLREPTAESQKSYTSTTNAVSAFLAENHDGGKILMESFGNDMVMFNARIPLSDCIYEGSFRLWEPALQDPANNDIQLIVMRHAGQLQPDKVYRQLYNTEALAAYDLAFENDAYYIYERRSS